MAGERAEVGVTLTLDDQMSAQLTTAERQLQATANRMQRVGSQLRTAGVMMTVTGAAGAYMSDKLVKGAASTEQAYARVNTMLGEGEDSLEDYGGAIKRLTRELPIQGGEVAALDAMYQVLSAGVEHGADATAVLEASMKASIGGMTSVEVAVDATTTALNAYGLAGDQASMVTDIMLKVVERGKTTYEELAGSIGPILSIAAQLGVDLEQVGASMATLTKAGISTDIAATSLRATLVSFLSPSEAMADSIQRAGYASGSAMLEALGLQGSLELLAKSTGGSQEAMAELFPNVRALTAVLPLTGEMARVAADDLKNMGESAGTTGKMFEDMAETTESQLTILENRMQQAKDQLANGATPAMLRLREATVRTAEGLAWLNDKLGGVPAAAFTVVSSILAVVGPMVALYGQYMLMKAAKIQIKLATQREALAHAENTAAITAETGAMTASTASIKANAGARTGLMGSMGGAFGKMGGALGTSAMGAGALTAGAGVGIGVATGLITASVQKYKALKEQNKNQLDALQELRNALARQGGMGGRLGEVELMMKRIRAGTTEHFGEEELSRYINEYYGYIEEKEKADEAYYANRRNVAAIAFQKEKERAALEKIRLDEIAVAFEANWAREQEVKSEQLRWEKDMLALSEQRRIEGELIAVNAKRVAELKRAEYDKEVAAQEQAHGQLMKNAEAAQAARFEYRAKLKELAQAGKWEEYEALKEQGPYAALEGMAGSMDQILSSYEDMAYKSGLGFFPAYGEGLQEGAASLQDVVQRILDQAIARQTELHSPAKEGILSRLDKFGEPFAETYGAGMERGARMGGLDAGVSAVTGRAAGRPAGVGHTFNITINAHGKPDRRLMEECATIFIERVEEALNI